MKRQSFFNIVFFFTWHKFRKCNNIMSIYEIIWQWLLTYVVDRIHLFVIHTVNILLVQLGHWSRYFTRRVPLVEQELLTLPEHLSSSPVFSGVGVTRSLVLYVCFVDRCFVLFLLAIVLFVLRYTDCNYPIDIFKFFLQTNNHAS